MPHSLTAVRWALGALLLAAAPAAAQTDCVRCDLLYGSTGGGERVLYELDPRSGALRTIGPVESYADLALTPDARLFGLGRGGVLVELDPCTAAAEDTPLVTIRPGATGTTRPDELLASGPFLQHVDLATGVTTDLPSGGWCGFAAGDLALNPCSGEAWQVSRGPDCPCPDGDTLLQVIDPATGDHLRDLACLPFTSIFGLAFDSSCTAWLGDADTGSLVRVDGATAEWTVAPASRA